jgi:hypothetical protein
MNKAQASRNIFLFVDLPPSFNLSSYILIHPKQPKHGIGELTLCHPGRESIQLLLRNGGESSLRWNNPRSQARPRSPTNSTMGLEGMGRHWWSVEGFDHLPPATSGAGARPNPQRSPIRSPLRSPKNLGGIRSQARTASPTGRGQTAGTDGE